MPNPVVLLAKRKEISRLAVVVGDGQRAEQLASLLKETKQVNSNRGLLAYIGYFGETRITIATHGIGGPSSAIVFEELHMLGARSIVRIGTCGGVTKKLNTKDFVVPTRAAHSNGSLNTYVPDGMLPAVPDFDLTTAIINECRTHRMSIQIGLVFSSDAFYNEDGNFLRNWAKRGVVAVDMECATLFTLGLLRGFRTAALLIVTDSLAKKTKEFGTADMLEKETESAASMVFNSLSEKMSHEN